MQKMIHSMLILILFIQISSAQFEPTLKAILPYEGVKAVAENGEGNKNTEITLYGMGSLGTNLNYKWILPDGIETADSDKYKVTFTAPDVTADSSFNVQLIVSNDQDADTTDVLVLVKNQISTSKKQPEFVENIKIYPNPTNTGFVNKLGIKENISYSIYDLRGSLRQSGIIAQNWIDINSLNNGLYIIQFEAENMKYARKIAVHRKL